MPPRTNLEILTVAVFLLGGDRHYVSTEDVAVKANSLAAGRFSWRKYKDQINLELVRVYLSDLKKQANGTLVLGSGSVGWMLTQAGVAAAAKAMPELASADLTRPPMSPAERRRYASEKSRMLETAAYSLRQQGSTAAPTQREAEELFRVDDYVVGAARDRKIERALTAFKDDPELTELLQLAAGVLRGGDSHNDR
jgi:hypothetical protein